MNYYKTIDNRVYAYGDDQMQWVADNNKIAELGLTPISEAEALAITNPPPTKEQRIAREIAAINRERDAELAALIVEYNGAKYDADEKSQLRMTAVLSLLSVAGENATQEWIDADNITRSLTANDFAQIGEIIAQKVTQIMFEARQRKDAAIAEIEGE
ncbi:MAG: DUF4376 domain-containing protein [Helicobacteraceae bacterium]|jgi:hypothetical protein|nr:DUF4376 domain-containing protein [Helicobacteraceae bacterium]